MALKYTDTDRHILRLAVPNVISNISVPLLGMADTAVRYHYEDMILRINTALGI